MKTTSQKLKLLGLGLGLSGVVLAGCEYPPGAVLDTGSTSDSAPATVVPDAVTDPTVPETTAPETTVPETTVPEAAEPATTDVDVAPTDAPVPTEAAAPTADLLALPETGLPAFDFRTALDDLLTQLGSSEFDLPTAIEGLLGVELPDPSEFDDVLTLPGLPDLGDLGLPDLGSFDPGSFGLPTTEGTDTVDTAALD